MSQSPLIGAYRRRGGRTIQTPASAAAAAVSPDVIRHPMGIHCVGTLPLLRCNIVVIYDAAAMRPSE